MIGVTEQHLTSDERHGDTTYHTTTTGVLNRRTQVTYPDATTATLTYDQNGNLTNDGVNAKGKRGQATFLTRVRTRCGVEMVKKELS